MTEDIRTVEDVLSAANEIYQIVDSDQKEAMRALIDTYYSKVQNMVAQKTIFSESDAICPRCTGVRLLRREAEISSDSSVLNKDYKCPICKSWYATSEVRSTGKSNSCADPISIWSYKDVPQSLAALVPEGEWIIVLPMSYRGEDKPPFLSGKNYSVLPDGRIGQTLPDGTFRVENDVNAPDLFGCHIIVTMSR